MGRIFYIGFYDSDVASSKRLVMPSAVKKMNYVIDSIISVGNEVEIISLSQYVNQSQMKVNEVNQKLKIGCSLKFTPSYKSDSRVRKVISSIKGKIWLFSFLIKLAPDDIVILYHNPYSIFPAFFSKIFRRYKLILEIEDIYSNVWRDTPLRAKIERYYLNLFKENSIVVSETMAAELDIKQSIICYGTYGTAHDKTRTLKKSSELNTDLTIKMVFTGYIDRERGGAFVAMSVLPILPTNYVLYISGPIAEKDKSIFFEKIDFTNELCGRKAVEYCGLLDDEEYSMLLQEADIALNLQKQGEYDKYIFPSKILTYLSYGLTVITTKGTSIIESSLSDVLVFTDSYDVNVIANTILQNNSVDKDKIFDTLKELDDAFKTELKNLLNN